MRSVGGFRSPAPTPSARFSALQGSGEQGSSAGGDHPSQGRDEDGFSADPLSGDELDEAVERAEGESASRELQERYGALEGSPFEPLLERCGARLAPLLHRPLPYCFRVLATEIPFASSCPNGEIWFTAGLLESLDEPSVFFFAAHELAHTELRHFATRPARLRGLRAGAPSTLPLPARLRYEQASVLAVRHLEEFEADAWAAAQCGSGAGQRALEQLEQACLQRAPASLQRPTHPPYPTRRGYLTTGEPPDPRTYLAGLLG